MRLLSKLFSSKEKFTSGQVWAYNTRAGEEKSRLYICRIDSMPGGQKIYHLYVDGLAINNPYMAGGKQDSLTHMPVDEQALNRSVVSLLGTTTEIPDISSGYNAWKEAFDSGSGGVLNLAVADIIQSIEDVLSSQTAAN